MGSGKSYRNLLVFLYLAIFVSIALKPSEAIGQVSSNQDTTQKSILKLQDVSGIPWETRNKSPLYLDNPSNIKSTVIYDPDKNEYIIYQKVGSFDYRTPVHMNPEEFRKYQYSRAMHDYWESRISGKETGFRSTLIPQIEIGGATFDKIFGSNTINIVPQGSAELIFGVNISKTENPTLSEKLRTIPTFDFKEKIQMNVTGTIGDKMQVGINYNTEATFDFENKTKLEYTGKEDEIIKKIEAGNVSFSVPGTLISGSQPVRPENRSAVREVVRELRDQPSTGSVTGGGSQRRCPGERIRSERR